MKIGFALIVLHSIPSALSAQQAALEETSPELNHPKWYFGESFGLNLNTYQGNAQDLNANTYIPTPFMMGEGEKATAAIFIEYKAFKNIGFLLSLGYDNRGGKFKEVMAPCNCPENLTTNLAYATLEPSIKFSPFNDHLFVFVGPTLQVGISQAFKYTQLYQTDINDDFGEMKKYILGGQIGVGYDFYLSDKNNLTQIILSPFASYQTKFRPSIRPGETWEIQSIRVGLALKIGATAKVDNR